MRADAELDAANVRKRWCYYVPEAQDPEVHGGYVPSMVEENEPGHSPMLGRGEGSAPWIWGKTLKEAQEVCDRFNADMGIDKETAFRIVASSMGAGRTHRRRL